MPVSQQEREREERAQTRPRRACGASRLMRMMTRERGGQKGRGGEIGGGDTDGGWCGEIEKR